MRCVGHSGLLGWRVRRRIMSPVPKAARTGWSGPGASSAIVQVSRGHRIAWFLLPCPTGAGIGAARAALRPRPSGRCAASAGSGRNRRENSAFIKAAPAAEAAVLGIPRGSHGGSHSRHGAAGREVGRSLHGAPRREAGVRQHRSGGLARCGSAFSAPPEPSAGRRARHSCSTGTRWSAWCVPAPGSRKDFVRSTCRRRPRSSMTGSAASGSTP